MEVVTIIAINPSLEARHNIEALRMLEYGGLFSQHGFLEEAIAAYGETQKIEPELELSTGDWNKLCWYGSLWEYTQEVMDGCERAVALAPKNAGIRDSRGLAGALSGDHPGAIDDFVTYVDWLVKNGGNEYEKSQRKLWISELVSDRNPFNEETLKTLR